MGFLGRGFRMCKGFGVGRRLLRLEWVSEEEVEGKSEGGCGVDRVVL